MRIDSSSRLDERCIAFTVARGPWRAMHRDVSRVRMNLDEPVTEGQTMPPAYS
jgi:hypothetical protein